MDREILKKLLDDTAQEFAGLRSPADFSGLANYTVQQAALLATSVGQPGFDEAVVAARNAVALYAGIAAVREADALDQRILGIVQTALVIGARTT